MQLKYSFICDYASIDAGGKINAIGIFEEIYTQQFPFAHQMLAYVAAIEFHRSEAGEHTFKISFVDDDGQPVLPPVESDFTISGEMNKFNIVLPIVNLNIQKAGTIEFDLLIDRRHVSANAIRVTQAPPEP